MKINLKNLSALALVALTTLAGCGGDNSTSESTSDGGTTKSVTVTMWHTFGQGIVDTLEDLIDEFEALVLENEGVEVTINLTYKGSYDDIEYNIEQGFAAGNIPTIAVAYADHVANYLEAETTEGEYVVNLQDYMDNAEYGLGTEEWLGDDLSLDETDFVESFLEEGRQFTREGTYILPFMKSSEVMFYNTEAVTALLDILNVSYSSLDEYLNSLSWDEFMDLAEAAQTYSSQILSTMEVPVFYDSDSNLFITKMFQNEIAYSSVDYETESGVIDFESGEARTQAEAMVTSLKEDFDKGLFTTKGVIGEYGSNYFTEGKTIFSIGSSGGAGYQIPSSSSFTVGVCMVPADNNNPVYVSQGPSLCLLRNPSLSDSVNDERVLYAWKFLKYITNADKNVQICVDGSQGYIPVRNSAYETSDYLAFLAEGEDYATTAKVLINDIAGSYLNCAVFKGSATLRDQVGALLTNVLNGSKSVTTAFDDAISTSKLSM